MKRFAFLLAICLAVPLLPEAAARERVVIERRHVVVPPVREYRGRDYRVVRPIRPYRAYWVPGHYVRRHGNLIWIPGHWR